METRVLYRPIGVKELELIAQTGFKAFPPRLPFQPIFYPVVNFEYAEQIAKDWNTKDPASGCGGFVTRFAVELAYVEKFPVQVGISEVHQELWVPTEELEEFNRHIVGHIEIESAYYGEKYQGEKDAATGLPKSITE